MTKRTDDIYIDIQKLENSIDEVKKMMDKSLQIALKAARRETVLAMFDLLGRAMRDAPVEFGDLRGSGLIFFNSEQIGHTESNVSGNGQVVKDKSVNISMFNFTGYLKEINGRVAFNKEYATEQHENMEYKHPRGGKAKYLEDNLKKMNSKYTKKYSRAFRKALNTEGAVK
jgi:hypothetical protein